ncbi:Hypothetical protein PHPALM_18452 [Phytophthora palmivora]|uniref:Uncharacterized protein n=1 Tax=Phytophthora palmivora TaxID=4796 RepID=A0A2P4XJP2_9STRA|nr:Hypothetical protein PHPALM_18452 [Phytophthora palmivora]
MYVLEAKRNDTRQCTHKQHKPETSQCDVKARESYATLKNLRSLHRVEALDGKTERHEQLLQTLAIQDPAPGYTQNIHGYI